MHPDIPKWKVWLSYLMELHIESAPSELNPHLYVSINQGRLQLCTANAIYSYEDLYDNFSRTFDRFKPELQLGKEALILGFGLGSVPILLERYFGESFYFTGIEADESVVYLADKYALRQISSPTQIITADAAAFVYQTQEKYNLIAMDVFVDDVVPEQFETIEYLEALRDSLSENGILLYNRLALTKADIEKTKAFYESRFLKVFPKGTYLDVNGNWMLVNRKEVITQP